MEVTQVGIRTRAKAMAMVAEETEDNSGAVKRRKVGNEKLRSPSSTFEQTKTLDSEIYVISALVEDPSDYSNASASLKSGGVPASICSSTGSMQKLKFADLEVSFETEAAVRDKLNGSERFTTNDDSIRSFMYITPTSEIKVEYSGELKSCTANRSSEMINSRRAVLSPEKMPPKAELEAFFAAAEEHLNKRFNDKYNYDIVNDIPLKGRYDWVQLKPRK